MIWTNEQRDNCREWCAVYGEPPCWQVADDAEPCADCIAGRRNPDGVPINESDALKNLTIAKLPAPRHSPPFAKEDVTARFNALIGHGWRTMVSEALSIDATQISRMNAPTLRTLGAILEWMEATPPDRWPKRWRRAAGIAMERR